MRQTARSLGCVMAVQLLLLLPSLALAGSTARQRPAMPPALAELPVTETGRNYHACLVELVQMTDNSSSKSTSRNRDGGQTAAPDLSDQLQLQVSQHVASRMSDALVHQFCEAVRSPGMQERLKNRAKSPDTAAAGEKQKNPGKAQQPQKPTRPHATVASPATGVTRKGPSALAVNTNPGVGYESVVPVVDIEYPPDGLATPGTADYWRSYTDRTDPSTNENFLGTCVAIEIASLIQKTVCAALGTVGTWEGEFAGAFQAPAQIPCLAALTGLQAGYLTCAEPLAYNTFYDDTVNDAELEATYDNVLATMDNQVLLWDKVDTVHTQLAQKVTSFKQAFSSWIATIATENCDLKTRVADAQREVNYLRYLLLTEEEKRPPFSGSVNSCSLSEPGYCSRPATNPVQALTSLKPQIRAACAVTDGVRDYDLTTEARQVTPQ